MSFYEEHKKEAAHYIEVAVVLRKTMRRIMKAAEHRTKERQGADMRIHVHYVDGKTTVVFVSDTMRIRIEDPRGE